MAGNVRNLLELAQCAFSVGGCVQKWIWNIAKGGLAACCNLWQLGINQRS